MRKIYLLDTNVLLHDPRSLFAFQDNEVIIEVKLLFVTLVLQDIPAFKKGVYAFSKEVLKYSGG